MLAGTLDRSDRIAHPAPAGGLYVTGIGNGDGTGTGTGTGGRREEEGNEVWGSCAVGLGGRILGERGEWREWGKRAYDDDDDDGELKVASGSGELKSGKWKVERVASSE